MEVCGETKSEKDEKVFKKLIFDMYEVEGHFYHAILCLWDDGIIDPVDTRKVLAQGLAAASNAPIKRGNFGVFRM